MGCHIFKTKVHQIRFRLGIRPDPGGEAHSAPPDLSGPTSKGREYTGRVGDGKEKGNERETRDGIGKGRKSNWRKRRERGGKEERREGIRGKGEETRGGLPPYFVQGPASSQLRHCMVGV